MTEQQADERSIFLRAIELDPGRERAAFLDAACGADPALRAGVEGLLAAHDWPAPLLDSPVVPGATIDGLAPERHGTVLGGRYRLVEEVGEGGMGTVWLAQQTEPVKRLVAVKLIKPGLDSKQVLARFEAERQTLALMDHPHIAKVHDAGATPDGRPYFVMELVRGMPITHFCDDKRLTPKERLALFVPVCQAVQHAHQKGVIHRDLKPSNILVAPYDGRPVVKVIDFGVAKAAGQPLTDKTLVTGFGAVVGTPEYMSPEQAELNNQDIDTRSDVYSLGVLLYQLLTGSTPLEHKRVRETGLLEALRIVREEEIPTLGNRLGTTAELLAIAARRGLDAGKLTRLVRGELNWVVMRALEKDRVRRYQTAGALAADVQQYLADGPVQACPPSAPYCMQKFARRNRAGLAAAGLIVSAVVLAGAGVGWAVRDRAARQADAARERAEREAEKDREVARGVSDAARARDARRRAEAREAVKRVEWLLAEGGREAGRGRLHAIVADLDMLDRLEEIRLRPFVTGLGSDEGRAAERDYAAAFRDYGINLETLEPAEAARRVRAAPIREELVCALDDWAGLKLVYLPNNILNAHTRAVAARLGGRRLVGEAEPAEPTPRRLSAWGAVACLADPDRWRNQIRNPDVLTDRSALVALADQPDAAVAPPSTALLLARALAKVKARDKAMAVLYAAQQRFPTDLALNLELAAHLEKCQPSRSHEAVGFARAALARRPDHPALHDRLGDLLLAAGHTGPALAAYREARVRGRDEADTHFGIGEALARQGAWADAIAAYQDAIRRQPNSDRAHKALAWAYRNTGEWDKAIASLEQELKLQLAPAAVDGLVRLAWVLATCPGQPRRDIDRALELAGRATDRKPNHGPAWNALGVARYRSGDLAGAVTALDQGARLSGGGSAFEWYFLAMAHERLGRRPKARELFTRAEEWMKDRQTWLAENPVYREELQRFRAEAESILNKSEPSTGAPRPAKGQ